MEKSLSPSVVTAQSSSQIKDEKEEKRVEQICQWIQDLGDHEKRENALLEISKRRESVEDLAVWLWYSYGTVSVLLQEIISIYPYILPPTLTALQSNRVCNALALMQCIASHKDTRKQFLEAKIPLYLYPFLHTTNDSRPFEYLRLTSLGVLGALVKTDEKDVIKFLLSTEIIPLCLRIMEQGTELSRTVATFILQKVLLDDIGLSYVCQTYERFSHVAMVLGKMVIQLSKDPSPRLLKHLIRCLPNDLFACTVQNRCVQLDALQTSFENATINRELYNELDSHIDYGCIFTSGCMEECNRCPLCMTSKQQLVDVLSGSRRAADGECSTLVNCAGECVEKSNSDLNKISYCLRHKCAFHCFDGSCPKCSAFVTRIFNQICIAGDFRKRISEWKGHCYEMFRAIVMAKFEEEFVKTGSTPSIGNRSGGGTGTANQRRLFFQH